LNTIRSLLIGAGVACALAAADRAHAAPRLISLVVSSSLGNAQHTAATVLRREIQAHLGDHVAVDLRASLLLGSENTVFAAVPGGAVDVAILSGAVVGPVVPEFGIFDVPFLFRDSAHLKAVAEGPVGELIAAKFAAKGLVLLAIGEQGARNITNSRHPVRTPADLRGLRIRVLPNDIYAMTFRALGAEVVPMEFPLVYGALKDGRIDGEENPVVVIAGNRLQEVQKYLTLTAHFIAPVAFVMNRETFESLDPVDRNGVVQAAKVAAEATRRAAAESFDTSLERLKKDGMEVTATFDRQAFIDAVKPLEPEFERRFGKELLAAVRATP
jgi:tripartite ATP-independent transporter DctP family solute receptor